MYLFFFQPIKYNTVFTCVAISEQISLQHLLYKLRLFSKENVCIHKKMSSQRVIAPPVSPSSMIFRPSFSIWSFRRRQGSKVETILATVEIIMRIVARAHRLIQLNDSFAGPKHHLRVRPVPSVSSRPCARAPVWVRVSRAHSSSPRKNVSRRRTNGPSNLLPGES